MLVTEEEDPDEWSDQMLMKMETSLSKERRYLAHMALAACLSLFFVATASAQAEFFDTAFTRASQPPPINGNGAGWVITAKVSLNGSGKEYISARGPVTLKSEGSLTGALPMSIDNKEVANNTINISIRRSNPAVVTVTRMIGGRPFLGKPAVIASLKVDPNFNYLSGPLTWTDGNRVIRIDLETVYVNAKPQEAKKKGVRYQIGGFFRVSNSSDGVADNTVELYGFLTLHHYRNGQEVGTGTRIFELIPQDAINGFQLPFKNIYIDSFEGDNDTLTLEGAIFDRDAGQGLTGDDLLFGGAECMTKFGLYNLFRISLRDGGSMLCKGDQNSESGDIRIFAKKVKDL